MNYMKDGISYGLAELRKENPNVSFPKKVTDALMAEYGAFPYVETEEPTYDAATQKLAKGSPVFNQGQWTQTWVVTDKTATEIQEELNEWRQTFQVSMRQARLALLQYGLLQQVNAAIAAMEEPAKTLIETEWEYASVVDRSSPWMGQMAVALGLSETQMDELFKLAATL